MPTLQMWAILTWLSSALIHWIYHTPSRLGQRTVSRMGKVKLSFETVHTGLHSLVLLEAGEKDLKLSIPVKLIIYSEPDLLLTIIFHICIISAQCGLEASPFAGTRKGNRESVRANCFTCKTCTCALQTFTPPKICKECQYMHIFIVAWQD